MLDFTEPMRIGPRSPRRPSPITSVRLSTSTLSPTTARRSMTLVEVHVDRVDSGLCIGSLERELLTAWIGGCDALALSVARRTDTADHRVHPVAIPTRIAQALEDHDARAFAHDEAVRALIKRCGVIGRQGPNLAELGVGGDAHGAIRATRDTHVDITALKCLYGRLNSRHRARTGCIDREFWSTQIKGIGDPARDDVGELARHGVFVDDGEVALQTVLEARQDLVLHCRIQLGEGRQTLQRLLEGRHPGSHDVVVRDLTAHGVTEDDAHAGSIKLSSLSVARVFERLTDALQGDLLDDDTCFATFRECGTSSGRT